MRKSLWFIVPCLGRFELTRMTLGELAALRDVLDYDVRAVVIARDENLDTAREFNFSALTEMSAQVGYKFNDGYQHALLKGADYVCHWQSDNSAIPEYFAPPPGENEIISTHTLAIVDGERTAYLHVEDEANPYGAGPFLFPARMLEPLNGRPIRDDLHNGVDRDLVRSLRAANPAAKVVYRDIDRAQFVSYKDSLSINGYDALAHLAKA